MKEALKLALEALESCYSTGGTGNDFLYQYYDDDLVTTAITAIKEVLAQPDQGVLHIDRLDKWLDASLKKSKQRTWVGLTDEEKQEWIDAMPYDPQPRHCMTLVNIIESKLKEKNT